MLSDACLYEKKVYVASWSRSHGLILEVGGLEDKGGKKGMSELKKLPIGI